MGTKTNEIILQENGISWRLKKSLLPIDEYAKREGLSTGIIEECGKLGIVQTRKFKGKTFVVDIPLIPYSRLLETSDKAAAADDDLIQAGTISQLVKKMVLKACRITGKPVEIFNDEIGRDENTSDATDR